MKHFFNKLPFANQAWFMYLRLLTRHFIDDDCQQKAASLTYTTLLSLVPILTVILVVFSSVPALEGVREQLQDAIYSNLMPSSGNQISHYFEQFAEKSSNLGLVGVLGLFVTTIMTLMTIEAAFNKIWRVQERSGGMSSLVRYWGMITLGPIVLGVAFGASSAIQSVDFLNRKVAGYGIDWSMWAYLVSLAVMVAGFIGMYWFIPKVQVPIKNAAIAGVVSAALFELLKNIFGGLMSDFTSYEAIYGAFAALPIFLLWIYLSWNIILLGVEISYTLTIFDTKEVAVRHPILSLLDMLNLSYKRYQQGKTVSEQQLREVLGRKELPNWSLYINQLVKNKLITRAKDDTYILKTDLNTISLWHFYKMLPYPLPIKDELDALQAADYDPWFVELYNNLTHVERTAKKELDISLAQLLGSTPMRQKQQIEQLPTMAKTVDDLGNNGIDPKENIAVKDTISEPVTSVIEDTKDTIKAAEDAFDAAQNPLKNKARSWLDKGKKVIGKAKKAFK